LNDQFLAALAKGGFQVGELAKCYFPGGINIDELDYETALSKTNALLEKENVIIYEAAFLFETLFIRTDVIVKRGNTILIYEVKAKSADSANELMTKRNGMPNSDWNSYLCDIAFQKHVVCQAKPGATVKAFLMVADESVTASVDGLNQKFLLGVDEEKRTKVDVVGDISPVALGTQLLCDQITILNNKVTKARELLLNDDIDALDYKSIKSETESKISVLEAKLADIGTDFIKVQDLEPIVDKAISTLTKIDVIYWKSDSSMQRKIIGSIYPEKFTFEDLKDRTAEVTDPFKLIYLINSSLNENKNGATDQNLMLSRWVFLHGLEPRSSEPESDMLPLHHRKINYRRAGIFSRTNIGIM
jgi:hypothetical protein